MAAYAPKDGHGERNGFALTRTLCHRSGTVTVASLLSLTALAARPALAEAPPPHAAPAAAFAAASQSDMATAKPPTGAAATIDGHVISMDEVIAICLREVGPRVVDRLIQKYVVDRECQRRGIVVTQAEIDQQIEELRKSIAPTSLEDGLKAHKQTRAMLEDDIRQTIERVRLVMDKVPPTKMVHCRVIMVPFRPADMPVSLTGTQTTEAQAQTTVLSVRRQLKEGKSFATLAGQYSDIGKDRGGDFGVLYDGIRDIDTAVLQAALALHKGETVSEPVKANGGYCLVQAISTSDDHPADEDVTYAAAERTYKEQRAQYLVGQGIVDLIARSKVEYFLHD